MTISFNTLPELAGDGQPGASAAWAERRDEAYRRFADLAGIVPIREGQPKLERLATRRLRDTVELWHIRYESHEGDWVPAYVLIPDGTSAGAGAADSNEAVTGARPAVLALHQTMAAGKDEIVGLSGDPELAYAIELAERGFVVLAPDVLTAGERIYPGREPFQTAPFEDAHPDWSMVGKMLADHRYGIELLASLPFVDAARIGTIGHSLGGYNAYFLAAVEEKVRAAVCSCGFSTFRGDANPGRWGNRKEWFTHFPKLDGYLREGRLPFEFNEVAALVCPKPLFIWAGQNDAIFPHWQAIGEGMQSISRLYESESVGADYTGLMGSCGHQFPRDIRGLAYAWLERALQTGK